MKAIFLLIFGLLLLGGAGFGAWMLYQKFMVPPAHQEAPKKEEPKGPPPTAFLRLAPVVVPVIGKTKVDQFVTVVVTLEVDATKLPVAQSLVPRLSDAFISTLYGAVDDKSVMSGALVNIPAVKEKLTTAAAKVLGPGVLQNVLIQVVTQRNL